MRANARLAKVSAALTEQADYLTTLATSWDDLQRRFDETLASVNAAHSACAPSDGLAEMEELNAGLDSIEWLASKALATIDELLTSEGGDANPTPTTAGKDEESVRNLRGARS